MERAIAPFFPAPWGPGEGSNVKYHLISITKATTTLCGCSQNKKILNISNWKRKFLDPRMWVMPQGWGLGCCGGQKYTFSKQGHVAYQIEGDDE